jgi:hypothetical protein
MTLVYQFPWLELCPESSPRRSQLDSCFVELARYYQSLLDSGKFESRAALARYLGVSRARVTQVLNRLQNSSSGSRSALRKGESLQEPHHLPSPGQS